MRTLRKRPRVLSTANNERNVAKAWITPKTAFDNLCQGASRVRRLYLLHQSYKEASCTLSIQDNAPPGRALMYRNVLQLLNLGPGKDFDFHNRR